MYCHFRTFALSHFISSLCNGHTTHGYALYYRFAHLLPLPPGPAVCFFARTPCSCTRESNSPLCILIKQPKTNLKYVNHLFTSVHTMFTYFEKRSNIIGLGAVSWTWTWNWTLCSHTHALVNTWTHVCNIRARYSGDWNFRQCFYPIWYIGHPLTST